MIRIAGVAGTVEDFSLRRTTLRDLDGVVHTVPNGEIVVASNLTRVWSRSTRTSPSRTAPTSTRRPRSSTTSDARWRPTRSGSAASSRRRRSIACVGARRVRRHAQDPGHGPRAGPVGCRRRASASASSRRSTSNGIDIPRTAAASSSTQRPVAPSQGAGAGPSEGDLAAGSEQRSARRSDGRRQPALAAVGSTRPAETVDEGERERRAPVPSPEIENLLARVTDVPARPRLHRAGERHRRPVRRSRGTISRRSGRSALASGSTGTTPFDTTLEWDLPFAKWFIGGQLNVSYNCVDRHVERRPRRQGRLPLDRRAGRHPNADLSRDLQREVRRPPTRCKELGVQTGDRVAIYMPMIPELPIAMLACARIGAPHTVVFGGFSAEALAGRINDARRSS